MIGVGAGLITGIAVVAVIEVVVQGILPFKKLKGKPKRWHPWAALVLPALISAAGAPALSLGLISQPAIAFVIGMYLFWKKLMPRITTLLWLVGGFLVSGALGSAAAATVTALVNQLGTTGARFTGFSAAAILAGLAIALTAEVLIKGASPFKKTFKANPKRYHPPLALALPTVVAASGLPVVTEVLRSISSVVI
jgi:hypothetical protein